MARSLVAGGVGDKAGDVSTFPPSMVADRAATGDRVQLAVSVSLVIG